MYIIIVSKLSINKNATNFIIIFFHNNINVRKQFKLKILSSRNTLIQKA